MVRDAVARLLLKHSISGSGACAEKTPKMTREDWLEMGLRHECVTMVAGMTLWQ